MMTNTIKIVKKIVKAESTLQRATNFNQRGKLSKKAFFYTVSTILAFTSITLAPSVTAQENNQNSLPSPQTIIARYIEVIGGEEAISSHSSMTIMGQNIIEPIGLESEITIYRAAPNKQVISLNMGPMGSSTRGYNGSVGWSESSMTGTEAVQGKQLTQEIRNASFYPALNYASAYPQQETIASNGFHGEQAYKVSLMNRDDHSLFLYFSLASGLLIGTEEISFSPMGESNMVTVLSDYKEFDGVLISTLRISYLPGVESHEIYHDITFNDVDLGIFEAPALLSLNQ